MNIILRENSMNVYNSINNNNCEEKNDIERIIFQQISSLITSMKYNEAAILIEEQFKKNIYDIRIIIFYFFCRIIIYGIKEIPESIKELYSILNELNECLTPEKNYKKILSNSLTWFHKNILIQIKFLIFENKIQRVLDLTNYYEQIDKYKKLLINNYNIESSGELTKIEEVITFFEVEKIEEKVEIKENEIIKTEENIKKIVHSNKSDIIFESYSWKEIKRKILLFRSLINEERYLEAALFFKDINKSIISFDPRKYFPEVFYPFYESMTNDFKSVLDLIDKKSNTLQWHIVEQMYNADYESLVTGNSPFKTILPDNFEDLSTYLKANKGLLVKKNIIANSFSTPSVNDYLNNSIDSNKDEYDNNSKLISEDSNNDNQHIEESEESEESEEYYNGNENTNSEEHDYFDK